MGGGLLLLVLVLCPDGYSCVVVGRLLIYAFYLLSVPDILCYWFYGFAYSILW